MKKANALIVGIITMAAVIVIVIGLLLIFQIEEAPVKNNVDVQLSLCSHIAGFECLEYANQFDKGESVWLVTQVSGLSEQDKVISYQQSIKFYDPSGKLIAELSGVKIDESKPVSRPGSFSTRLKNQYTTSSVDDSGAYVIEVTVTDKNSEVFETQQISFILQ